MIIHATHVPFDSYSPVGNIKFVSKLI